MTSALHSKQPYFGAIDGLRAIAVLLVLFFHLDVRGFHSGFIGVDVFFVISGFLITRQITQDVERGQFTFLNFYFRRIARLLPSVLTVVLLTLVAGHFFLIAPDYARLGFSGFLSTVSLSNFLFWTEAGYFTQASDSKPLLHMWSLAVEEQFYLIWPILLAICLASGRRLLVISMSALGILSFMGAVYFHRQSPEMVFYLAPFRIFQFIIGGLICFLPAWNFRNRLSVIGLLSVILLFGLAAGLPDDFAGFDHVFSVMLLPAILAGAFVFTARSPLQEGVFASPILKYLGDRSYAIYLTHWPIIIYWNMATDYVLSSVEQTGLFVVSLISAELLHQGVEKRFRLRRFGSAKKVLQTKLFLLGTGLVTVILAVSIIHFNGTLAKESSRVAKSEPAPRCFMRIQDKPELYGIEKCATGPKAQTPRVLVFGDSFVAGAYIALRRGYKTPYVGHYAIPSCPLETPADAAVNKTQCNAHYNHAYEKVIKKDRFDYIVLAVDWVEVSDDTLLQTTQYFESLGLKVVIMGLRPHFRERIPTTLAKLGDRELAKIRANRLINQDAVKRSQQMRASYIDSNHYVDLMALVCAETCEIETPNGAELYRDYSHFTPQGAYWLGAEIEKSYPNLFQ